MLIEYGLVSVIHFAKKYMNITYLNCGERYEDIVDHRSYVHNLSRCEIKAWKKIQTWTEFELMTSAIPVQCPTNWAIKPSRSWSLCDFVMVRNILADGDMIFHVLIHLHPSSSTGILRTKCFPHLWYNFSFFRLHSKTKTYRHSLPVTRLAIST